jgi:hypothetical protein
VKTLLKKCCLWLAAPLLRQIDKRCESLDSKQSEQLNALKLKLEHLEGVLSDMSRGLTARNDYIDLLQKNGLHEIIAYHANLTNTSADKVAAVLGDMASGMEPSIASRIHDVNPDDIVRWFGAFKAHIRETDFIQIAHSRTSGALDAQSTSTAASTSAAASSAAASSSAASSSAASSAASSSAAASTSPASSSDLLQRQLEFNAKNSFDRERAASLQIARLTKELELEKQSGLRALADR